MNELMTHTPRQLALVKNTVAKDCNAEEFSLFVEVARGKGLDPFLGQIIPMVFSKGDAAKRKMTIIITRDGQRVIAQRCGDYRAASKPPTYEVDASLVSGTNPLGLVSATVYLWKQDPHTKEWHEIAGQAYWDEFAPIKNGGDFEWVDTGETWPDTGKPKKKKKMIGEAKPTLDDSGNWTKQPRLMLAKCAEMQALRAGWPAQFAGLYDDAEMSKAVVNDRDASEIVEAEYEEQRMARIGVSAGDIFITWGDGWTTENVPVGKFFDRAAEFVSENDPVTVQRWSDANRIPLQQFWAKAPGDALALKKLIEAKTEKAAAA
jgi:phage recombination protein Bet